MVLNTLKNLTGLGSADGGAPMVHGLRNWHSLEPTSDARVAALRQFQNEFTHGTFGRTRFDALVDGMNRLPRPLLALGMVGLFVYAMVAPQSFGISMASLDLVPEEMWWLFGAVVSFFFGARELHYLRKTSKDGGGSYVDHAIDTLQNIQRLKALPTDLTPGVAASSDESLLRDVLDDLDADGNAAVKVYKRRMR